MAASTQSSGKTFIVEHLDPELGPWSELEYLAIGNETRDTGGKFILSCLPDSFQVPEGLKTNAAFTAEQRGVEELYAANKDRVCLLDPAAAKDLSPEDAETFDAFLFGGILGKPLAKKQEHLRKLTRSTKATILRVVSCEPMPKNEILLTRSLTDRTSELRKKGYEGRRLGPKQMTTDTAVRVTRIVVQDKSG